MTRFSLTLALIVGAGTAQAGWFSKGVGDYGPYTGGHGYSYNTAYSYGFTWSAADSWRRDIFAYPAGIAPYRPYGKPISCRVFPRPETPYISVPGPDGLPMLIQDLAPIDGALPPDASVLVTPPMPGPVVSPATPHLMPVPDATSKGATIRIRVPESAEVWVEKEKLPAATGERTFQTAPLTAGNTQLFSVRARWTQGGRDVEEYRVVGVKAGETAKLAFGTP